MKLAFITTQSIHGSTVAGRVIPLAKELSLTHDVHVFIHTPHSKSDDDNAPFRMHEIGADPFVKTDQGKKRKKGIALLWQMLRNAMRTTYTLFKLKPQVVVICKPLPQNVLGVKLWSLFNRKATIILDVDDFELTANFLTSIAQRAAIHWAERVGAGMSFAIVAASPFLKDHFEQLTNYRKKVYMIPTGLSFKSDDVSVGEFKPNLLYIGSVSESSGHKVSMLPDILAIVKKEIPNVVLHIAGSGDDMESLKKSFLKKGLQDAVIWHGRFQMDEVHTFLNAKTIIIDPIDASINNRAKSSFRAAMAASVGLPVVTSNIGIRPYLIPETLHQRFFAKPEDAADYAQKVITLIRTPLSGEESAAMKIHSKHNTWHYLGKKYEDIIIEQI